VQISREYFKTLRHFLTNTVYGGKFRGSEAMMAGIKLPLQAQGLATKK
jgi:hypothetical protein